MISKLAPYKTLDAIYSFADSHRKAFLGKFTAEQYFKSLEDKSNSLELLLLHFLQYIEKVRDLTNLILFSFGLADDQKSFNAACKYIFLHF